MPFRGSASGRMLTAALLVVVASGALLGCLTLRYHAVSNELRPVRQVVGVSALPMGSPESGATRWRRVLQRLSGVREQAWASGRVELLRRVYDPSSLVLRKDAFMLSRYVDRGLRVHGARLEFGRVKVERMGRTTVELRVTDQLRPAVAVGSDGRRVLLPYDRASRHLIVLRRHGGHWRILMVRP